MILLQGNVWYGPDATKTPLKTVDVAFQVPLFLYTSATDAADVSREVMPGAQSTDITQDLSAKSYSVALPEQFIIGADDATSALAATYEMSALQRGDLEALTVSCVAVFSSDDGQGLGQQAFDVLVVPKAASSTTRLSMLAATAPLLAQPRYFAVARPAYLALQQQLADTSLHGHDALILTALSLLTSLDGNAPAYLEAATVHVGQWLDERTDGNDAATIWRRSKQPLPRSPHFLSPSRIRQH